MIHRLLYPTGADQGAVQSDPLRVVVAYENTQARERIEDVYAHLVGRLSGEFRFGCTWCNFEELKNSRTAAHVAQAAREADLILFSTDAEAEPPFALLSWVESWAGTKAGKDTVLALLLNQNGENPEGGLAIKMYLHDVARRRDMDFLSQIIITPDISLRRQAAIEDDEEIRSREPSPLAEI